jgi:hypothetical protein
VDSQPSGGWPLQSPKPPTQAATEQMPALQIGAAWGSEAHGAPQAPQFWLSIWVLFRSRLFNRFRLISTSIEAFVMGLSLSLSVAVQSSANVW